MKKPATALTAAQIKIAAQQLIDQAQNEFASAASSAADDYLEPTLCVEVYEDGSIDVEVYGLPAGLVWVGRQSDEEASSVRKRVLDGDLGEARRVINLVVDSNADVASAAE